MQKLKESVRNRINEAALKEFEERGYRKSSMRRIADNAKIAVGNIYHYYKNKKALFDALIAPIAHAILEVIEMNYSNYLGNVFSVETFADMIVKDSITLMNMYRKQFLIMIDGAQGTAFEGMKAKMIEKTVTVIHEGLKPAQQRDVVTDEYDQLIVRITVQNLFESLVEIVRTFGGATSEEKQREGEVAINALITYTVHGLSGFIRKEE